MRGESQAGRIQRVAIYLRSSFWFMPACMIVAALALAVGLVEVEQRLDLDLGRRWPRMFAGEAEGSRAMLSAIATSMITVAGVVFSITIVALAQAATQYTSRVLRNFMRDRINQAVLGVFVGVFIYCVVVLRTISGGGGGDGFVPSLAVTAGLVLALVAIAFLIVFIHHIATSIQAGEIARAVMLDTREAIDRLFPDDVGTEAGPAAGVPDAGGAWQPVPSGSTGYIQGVLPDALLEFAVRHDTVVRMEAGIGEFIAEGRTLASLASARPPDPETVRALNLLYAVDAYRTTDQDPVYGFRQLVDIALKALSPAVNDSTTAVTCIDYLSTLLEQVARRRIESPCRSERGRLRVIARGPTFRQFADLAFGQILENAAGNTVVLERLLRMAEEVAPHAAGRARRAVLEEWIGVIEDVALHSARSTHARDGLGRRIARARGACG